MHEVVVNLNSTGRTVHKETHADPIKAYRKFHKLYTRMNSRIYAVAIKTIK